MNIHKIDIPIILCTDSFQILIFNISKFESILLYLNDINISKLFEYFEDMKRKSTNY